MNNISSVTKRDLKDLLDNGFMLSRKIQRYDMYDRPFMDEEEYLTKVSCCGRLSEVEFSSRAYDLTSLPSDDRRFSNAEQDIWQHTINNDDWLSGRVFNDHRFKILSGTDVDFLKFIVEIFNPVVRVESEPWKELLTLVNKLLSYYGYEYELIQGEMV